MMLLCFSGCSITWGDELQDRINQRFSTLVSKHYDCKALNLSENGISNDAIVRRTIKYLQNNKPDVLVMQFTVNQRIEYFDKQIENWTPQRIKTLRERSYYTRIYNDYLGAENLWKNIFLFDSFCKSIGQKYVSIVADHYEPIIVKPEKFYTKHNGYWRQLCKDLKPCMLQYDLLGEDKKNPQNYAQGVNGGHPSEEGHKLIANKIIELIDAI